MITQTPKSAAAEINIEDVQAIKDVTIPIARGTIVKLVGENGSGKSTAIQAVTSAITKENTGLRPRDGRMSGKVRMPGVTVTFGAKMTRKATGEESPVTFAVVEDGTGIGKILRPGVKDPVAADKRRLEGVLDVIGATLSVERIQKYLGEFYEEFTKSRNVDGKGFVDAVKEIKLFLEAKARDIKVVVTQCDGAISEIGVIGEPKVIEVAVDELAQQVEQLALEVRDAERDRERATKAVEMINQPSTVDIVQTQAELDTVSQSLEADNSERLKIQGQIDQLKAQIEQLNQQVSAVDKQIESRQSRRDTLTDVLKVARDSEARIERLKVEVGKAPTEEQIAARKADLEQLRKSHGDAIRANAENEQLEDRRQRLEAARTKRETADKQHGVLKALAHGTSKLLCEALEAVPGWKVDEDLRLCVEHKRGTIAFSELSPGEGTARVCLLACQFAECGEDEVPIVGLPQECFEGLDGRNRKLLLDSAAEHGLCILTAECDRNADPAAEPFVEVMS